MAGKKKAAAEPQETKEEKKKTAAAEPQETKEEKKAAKIKPGDKVEVIKAVTVSGLEFCAWFAEYEVRAVNADGSVAIATNGNPVGTLPAENVKKKKPI